MKKLSIFFVITLVVAVVFTSCNNSGKVKMPTLKTQIDSLNYAFGVANGSQIKMYYIPADSTHADSAKAKIAKLLKGINDGMKGDSDPKYTELSNLGTRIGTALKEQSKSGLLGDSSLTVDLKLIKQGLINGMKNAKTQMPAEEANVYLQTTMQKLQMKRVEKQYGMNKLAGQKFLEENAKKPGVVTTPSGLQYEVITKGTGALPTDTSKVKVHYHGTLIDGTVFDSSVQRKEPAEFKLNQVIKGWTEALKLMPVGSKYKIYVPEQLGYGAQEYGSIKPFSTLIFEIELLSIEK
jgi:FKBP-type peptidyl-prolyl cis-trans isomerase FkpA